MSRIRTLNEIGPQDGFQAAGIRVNDGDHAHDDDQQVDADSGEVAEHHARQVHDDGHTAHLIDDEHDRAEHAQALALEAQLQIMIRRINTQAAVNRQEKLNGQRNGQQHAELGKPHNPCARIGVARKGQK